MKVQGNGQTKVLTAIEYEILNKVNNEKININKMKCNEHIQGNYSNYSGNIGIVHMSGGVIKGRAKIAGTINQSHLNNLVKILVEFFYLRR